MHNMSSSSSFVNNMSFNSSMASSFTTSRRGKNRMDSFLVSSNSTHFLEQFGLPLPSMVKVAITNSTEHQKTTSRLDQNGYAWLVWGRKLYIWRHSQSDKRMTCRELMLPPSELVHNANLVCVVCNNGIPACIAASPEGLITYWPNVFNESMNISISADVPGQECDSLTSNWPTGCVLATTSGTVLLLKTVLGKGTKPHLICSPLPLQKSWLGGIGRKMSVLWNPVAGSNLEMKRAKVIVPPVKHTPSSKEPSKNIVYLLLGPLIQTWNITDDMQVSMGDINGEDILRQLFFANIWCTEGDQKGDLRGIQIWLLDLACLHNRKIAVLAAAKNSADSTNIVHFGIAIMDEQRARRVDEIKFVPVDHRVPFSEINDDHLYSWKLYCANNYYYIVSNELLLTVSDKDSSTDLFDSNTTGGPFLGSGTISGNVVIFVAKLGVLQVTYFSNSEQNMTTLIDSTLLEVRVPDHLSLSVCHGPTSMSDDNINVYKSVFLLYCGKKLTECHAKLSELFPISVPNLTPHDNIDTWTIGLCKRLIDDAPVSDPRWVSSFGSDSDQKDHLGLKSKILIKNFLMDKKEGLELFFGFLNGTGVLQRLTGTVIKEDVVSTTSVLYNYYEKIGFALALQNLQSNGTYRSTIDGAVRSIIQTRPKIQRSANLTPNDLFYKDVSKIHHIFPALIALEEKAYGSKNTTEIAELVKHTNEVLLTAIVDTNETLSDRIESVKMSMINHLMSGTNQYEYIPWLVQPTVLNCLVKQHELSVGCIDAELIKQVRQITDLILDGLKTNMESLIATDRYRQKCDDFEKTRLKLLKSQFSFDVDGARSLAEKYIDYEILVNICYDLNDLEQLQLYFERFNGFPEFVFEWYVKHKKHAELLDTFSLGKFSNRLKQFLKKYPQIAWHHMAITDDFQQAAVILENMADVEESFLVDKEFMLCLSTMASLAAEGSPNLERIDKNRQLIAYQNGISEEMLSKWGMDKSTMRVLSAPEIIDLYTSENESGNPEDFWNAWDVCDFLMNIDLRDEKRLIIITRAILFDPWASMETDHPMDVIRNSVIYQFSIGLLGRGENLDTVFPYEELLQMEDLQDLFSCDNAKFLLSACHEHLSLAEREALADSAVENMEM